MKTDVPQALEDMDPVAHRHAWPDRAIGELAARQRSVLTRTQLRTLGVSVDAIDRALRRRRLHRVHRGVYSVAPAAARPPLAAERAALCACGPTAVLSHHSAALLHGLRLPVGAASALVAVTAAADRRHAGVEVHTTTSLPTQERHRVQGLPATSVARTTLDLAPALNDRALAQLIDQALRITSRTKLLQSLHRHPRRRGTPRLRALLDPGRPSADTWSVAEARLLEAIRRSGLPTPEANVGFGGYVPDLLWREQRVAVEYDSTRYHSGPAAFDHDRSRHNELTARGGLQVLHVTHRQIADARERVIVWIALALAHGGYGV